MTYREAMIMLESALHGRGDLPEAIRNVRLAEAQLKAEKLERTGKQGGYFDPLACTVART